MDIREPNGSALCASCGLCCDGTLFDHAKAEEEELARLEAAGMDVFRGEDSLRFRQPCPAYKGACCSIYADRFATCRSFRCALLRRLEAGEVDLGQAQETVRTAKELLARVEAHSPGSRQRHARRALVAEREAALRRSPDPDTARAYLDLVALGELLDTRFRNPKKTDESA